MGKPMTTPTDTRAEGEAVLEHLRHMVEVRPQGLDRDAAKWALERIASLSAQLAETRKITEAMVEAGARVIAECTRTGIIEAPKLDWPCWMGTSRAIIEAALSPRDADAAAMRTTEGTEMIEVSIDEAPRP